MEEIRFCYLRPQKHSTSIGSVTAAYKIEDGYLSTGFAFCGTRDNYCKKLGKDIAIGRLKKSKVRVEPIIKNLDGKFDAYATITSFLNRVAASEDVETILGIKNWGNEKRDQQYAGNFRGWLLAIATFLKSARNAYPNTRR